MYYNDLESYLLYGDQPSYTDGIKGTHDEFSFEPIDIRSYIFGDYQTPEVSYAGGSFTDMSLPVDNFSCTDYDRDYTSDRYDGIISADYCDFDSVDEDYTLAEYETGYSSDCYFYEECLSSWEDDGSSYGEYETGTDYDITDM